MIHVERQTWSEMEEREKENRTIAVSVCVDCMAIRPHTHTHMDRSRTEWPSNTQKFNRDMRIKSEHTTNVELRTIFYFETIVVDGISFGCGRRDKPWHHRSPRNCQGSCDDGSVSWAHGSIWPSVLSFVSACVIKRDSMKRRNINEHCSGTIHEIDMFESSTSM